MEDLKPETLVAALIAYRASAEMQASAKYNEELGSFIRQFSTTEHSLVSALRRWSGVPVEIGPAIFGSVRVGDGIDAVRRVLEAKGDSFRRTKARLEPILAQFRTINTARNNIIHWGSDHIGEGKFRVTNEKIIHVQSRLQEHIFTADDLSKMTMDLIKIDVAIYVELERDGIPRDAYRTAVRKLARFPWQYKPSAPDVRDRRTGDRPKRPRQRPPSQRK